jgi:hypothetical protein
VLGDDRVVEHVYVDGVAVQEPARLPAAQTR